MSVDMSGDKNGQNSADHDHEVFRLSYELEAAEEADVPTVNENPPVI